MVPAWELVNQTGEVTAASPPLLNTEYSTQISGTNATRTETETSTVATLFVSLRLALTPWNVGALTGLSSVAVMPSLPRPATAARASEFTTNVRMNSTRPAAM